MRHATLLIGLIGFALLFSVEGCRGPTFGMSASGGVAADQVVHFAVEEDPRSMEPGFSVLLQDSVIALNLHVGLFRYDRDSALKPYLVRDWALSDDHMTFTFILHDDWKWHNGRVITADDIRKGWERYLNPKLGAWGANYLAGIAGAQEMLHGAATTLKGVKVVDSRTLKVTLARPDPLFLMRLGAAPAWTVPPETVVDGEPKWKSSPQGGGPFKFVQWQSHSRVVLEANPSFAGGSPSLKRLEFLIVPDLTTALNMYRGGELDVAPVAAYEVRGVKHDPQLGADLRSWPAAQLLYVGLNENRVPFFRDTKVRQSFAQAIDRRTICEKVLAGAWTEASEIVPDGVPGHLGKDVLPYDPPHARKLMAEAGFSNGRAFPTVHLAVAGETESTAAEAIAAQLFANLGIKVEVHRVEPGEFLAGLQQQRWDAFLTGWTADYLSAEQWLYHLLSHGEATNYVGYYNPHFEDILDTAMCAETADAQTPWWREANQIATADAALIPLGYGRFTFLVRPTISGFTANVFGPVGFENVHKASARH
jgi:oligopeptide transport system substrate-binding protein